MRVIVENQYYKLKRDDIVYLYGINNISLNAYSSLKKKRYDIRGIIDNKKNFNDTRFINKDIFKKKNIGNKEIVIIICLNDGMKHEVVAEEFFENGINKILFLPMNSGRSLEIDSIYRKSYTDFLDMSYDNVIIPLFVQIKNQNLTIIRETENSIIFLCPKELLRVGDEVYNKIDWEDKDTEIQKDIKKYIYCSIDEFDLYNNLWRYISNEKVDCNEYFKYKCKTLEEKKLLYENRRNLYNIYEQKLRLDMHFFYDSPAIVKWIDDSFGSIIDGLHRITYLNFKGFTQFPVKVKKHDYYDMVDYLTPEYNFINDRFADK